MAEVIDLTSHPKFRQANRGHDPVLDNIQSILKTDIDFENLEPNHFVDVSFMSTDDLMQELLSHVAIGRGLRDIPRDMIIIELASRLESYANILEDVLNKLGLEE